LGQGCSKQGEGKGHHQIWSMDEQLIEIPSVKYAGSIETLDKSTPLMSEHQMEIHVQDGANIRQSVIDISDEGILNSQESVSSESGKADQGKQDLMRKPGEDDGDTKCKCNQVVLVVFGVETCLVEKSSMGWLWHR
jgi:hypothetical protein